MKNILDDYLLLETVKKLHIFTIEYQKIRILLERRQRLTRFNRLAQIQSRII